MIGIIRLGEIEIIATQIHFETGENIILVAHLAISVLLGCSSQVKVHVLTIEQIIGHVKRHSVRVADVGRIHLE
jgi:hypothetical protein